MVLQLGSAWSQHNIGPCYDIQAAAEQLQNDISRFSQLLTDKPANLDPQLILKYAHKIAYTSFAPIGHQPGQPLSQHFRPPNPQEWQLRASQLHQFQGELLEVRKISCRKPLLQYSFAAVLPF